jgi:hypothetical protein
VLDRIAFLRSEGGLVARGVLNPYWSSPISARRTLFLRCVEYLDCIRQ